MHIYHRISQHRVLHARRRGCHQVSLTDPGPARTEPWLLICHGEPCWEVDLLAQACVNACGWILVMGGSPADQTLPEALQRISEAGRQPHLYRWRVDWEAREAPFADLLERFVSYILLLHHSQPVDWRRLEELA